MTMCERSQNNGGVAKSLPDVKTLQNVKVSAGFDCSWVRKNAHTSSNFQLPDFASGIHTKDDTVARELRVRYDQP
jgi:hypothetical protein